MEAAKRVLTDTWTFGGAHSTGFAPARPIGCRRQNAKPGTAGTIGNTSWERLRCSRQDLRSIIASTFRTGNCMNYRLHAALLATLGGSGLLGGCSTKTDVSLTGNTPAQYSHVWVTVQAVWFNGSATAGPDDGGWGKFPLSKPNTV